MELGNFDFLEGETILIDKPLEWTSFNVVAKVRGTIRRKFKLKKIKVGHCGTLDPLATGLLIICTGKKTKTINNLQGLPKSYKGIFKLGATTPSFDMETEEDALFSIDHISEEMILETTKIFIGKIDQFPPIFSAIKVNGVPMYKKARKGEMVELKSREVEITRFQITKIELPFVEFEVDCSKGTYIRSLAHDFGKALASGSYITALRRTKIGEFSVVNSWDINNLVTTIDNYKL